MAGSQTPTNCSLSSVSGRGKRIGRSEMRKLMCCKEDREITFSSHYGQNRLDLRKVELIYCQLFMYLIIWVLEGKKTNSKTLRETIFPFSKVHLFSFMLFPLFLLVTTTGYVQ